MFILWRWSVGGLVRVPGNTSSAYAPRNASRRWRSAAGLTRSSCQTPKGSSCERPNRSKCRAAVAPVSWQGLTHFLHRQFVHPTVLALALRAIAGRSFFQHQNALGIIHAPYRNDELEDT